MQLIDQEGLKYKLKPENFEDLWLLTQFISPEDIINSQTKRKVAIGDDKKKQVTKIFNLDILVKKVVFETQVLKVTGEIQNETQFTAIGQSHTLTFTPDDIINIEKDNLLNIEKQYLDKSLEKKNQKNLLIMLDKDDLIAVEFSDFSYSVLFKETGLGSKKYKNLELDDNEQKYLLIKDLLEKKYNQTILIGPAHFKDELKNYLKQKNIDVITANWQDISTSSINSAISFISKSGLIESSELKKENEAVSQLLFNIEKSSKFAYGFENTKESVNMGSVEKLLISTKFIEENRELNQYGEVEEIMKTVENLKGEIIIVNSKHTPGNQLDGLGGIAAILRY